MNRRIATLITGIYLLIASLNYFIIAGDVGRYVALAIGFLMITGVAFKSRLNRGVLTFTLIVTIILVIYLGIANIKNQYTSSPLLSLFTVISGILLIAGRRLSTISDFREISISPRLFLFFALSSLLSSFLFLRYQFAQQIVSRDFDLDETINSIGIAYSCGLQSVYLWIVGGVVKESEQSKVRILNVISIMSLVLVVVSTQSRGPLIFLFFTFLMIARKTIRLKRSQLVKIFIKPFSALTLLIIIVYQVEFISVKVQSVFNRLGSLYEHALGSGIDNSSLARQELQREFFEEFFSFILAGQTNYDHYPHNIFLEILMRWGFFGLPLLVLIVSSVYREFVKTKPRTTASLSHLLKYLMLFSLLVSFTSLSIEMNRILILSLGYFGTLRFYKNERRFSPHI